MNMYPVRLNLLAPEKQKRLRHIVYVQFAKNSLEVVVFVISLSGIILLGAQSVLQGYFNDIADSLTSVNQKQEEKNHGIKDVNRLLAKTANIQSLYTVWTPIIADISSAIPPRIVLSGLQLDMTKRLFVFTGNAASRDDLLDLQKNLKRLPFIESAIVPLSQLTEKANVSFSITATVYPKKTAP